MTKNQSEAKEISEVASRYERRKLQNISGLYSPTTMAVMMARQERERALIYWMHTSGLLPIGDKTLLEIGCGTGGNILEMLRFGFEPHNLVGNELLQDRGLIARLRLPAVTQIHIGDALTMDFVMQFDVVFQSTVFTSILDDEFQERLANRMWELVKPGGQILWYDFVYNNPKNKDVRGVPVSRIKSLFPLGQFHFQRVSLAPPIARRLVPIHPILYSVANILPLLRTHVLCWIQKPTQ